MSRFASFLDSVLPPRPRPAGLRPADFGFGRPPCACLDCQPNDWTPCPRCLWPHRLVTGRHLSDSDGDCERARMEDTTFFDHVSD